MSRKLVLLLMIILVLTGCNLRHKDSSGPQGSKAPLIAFDKVKALKAIYDHAIPINEGGNQVSVLWEPVNVPKPISEYFPAIPKGIARVIFDAPYKENGIDKRIVLVATAPAENAPACHACALLVGGAVFRSSADGWVAESRNPYIAVKGKYGTVENERMRVFKVGPEHYGVLFEGDDMHQGNVTNYVSLIVPYGKTIVESLQFYVEGNGAVCEDEEETQRVTPGIVMKQGAQRKDSREYYDLEAETSYSTGECDEEKSVQELKRFSFVDGQYKEAK
jgi:hypothetical protein